MADPASYRPAPGTIPTEPGVYLFSDAFGQVIYVGKAKNLRSRLNSYFADPDSLHFRTQTMVRTAVKVEWTVVQNELEALQLEYTWIKQYDPRFNIKYSDDKSYPWLAITWSEEYPRVFVGRGAKKKGWRYFGPFGQAWAIRETVDLLLRVFPMRSCTNGVFRNARLAGRPCLLGYIDKCVAPCVGRVSADEHRRIVEDFASFMGGHSRALERRLTAQMLQAAEDQEYERAALIRDSLEALKQVSERNAIVLADGIDADMIAFAADTLELAVQVFHVRDGRVRGEQGWVADRADDAEQEELIESFLLQLYADVEPAEIPREILTPIAPASGEAMAQLLTERRGGPVRIKVPQRGDKKVLLDTVARNASESLARHKLKRASDLSTRNRALEEIQLALDLDAAPLRIECFDISHLQGSEMVASMVVFEDGLPRKSEYRRFVIRTVDGPNDTASMREALMRRLSRLLDERKIASDEEGALLIDPSTGAPRRFAYAPSLIVVDGGQPQVNAAQSVLDELGLTDIALCGLAKRLEEVWLPGEEYPVILSRTSEGLYLLQRLRDEAHRFAITFHRGRRSKAMVESILDQIDGLGEVRRKTLIAHFGNLAKLRAATVEEIVALPGFGPRTAANVVAALEQTPTPTAINMTTGEVIGD